MLPLTCRRWWWKNPLFFGCDIYMRFIVETMYSLTSKIWHLWTLFSTGKSRIVNLSLFCLILGNSVNHQVRSYNFYRRLLKKQAAFTKNSFFPRKVTECLATFETCWFLSLLALTSFLTLDLMYPVTKTICLGEVGTEGSVVLTRPTCCYVEWETDQSCSTWQLTK